MAVFEIRAAQPQDVRTIASRLRCSHAKMVLSLGRSINKSLTAYYNASYYCRAWYKDNKLVALGGVTGSELSTAGYIWVAFAEEVLPYKCQIVMESFMQISKIMLTKQKLTAFIICADAEAKRFAEFLGFEFQHLSPCEKFAIYTLSKGI